MHASFQLKNISDVLQPKKLKVNPLYSLARSEITPDPFEELFRVDFILDSVVVNVRAVSRQIDIGVICAIARKCVNNIVDIESILRA